MSRTSSQQRFYDQPEPVVSESPSSDWRQQRSISRNDSQRSLTDYQQQLRQPDPLITTRIEESTVEPYLDERQQSVTYNANEYEQQPQNLQPMAQQGSSLYNNSQQQQQYQEPSYDQSYQQQPELGYATDNQQYTDYEPTQPNLGSNYPLTNQGYVPQPEPYNSNQYERQAESRRQSPEQRESPPRESPQYRDESVKSLQQRQQSRDQLYGREKTESPEEVPRSPSAQQRQQSRDSLQEAQQKSPSPTNATSAKGGAKTIVPPSPTRAKLPNKGATQPANSRNSVGEAARSGRKSADMQKQPSKTSVRSKK